MSVQVNDTTDLSSLPSDIRDTVRALRFKRIYISYKKKKAVGVEVNNVWCWRDASLLRSRGFKEDPDEHDTFIWGEID